MKKIPCEHCGRKLDPRGASKHVKACGRISSFTQTDLGTEFSVKFCPNCGLGVNNLRLVENGHPTTNDEPTPFGIKFCPACGLSISNLQLVEA